MKLILCEFVGISSKISIIPQNEKLSLSQLKRTEEEIIFSTKKNKGRFVRLEFGIYSVKF